MFLPTCPSKLENIYLTILIHTHPHTSPQKFKKKAEMLQDLVIKGFYCIFNVYLIYNSCKISFQSILVLFLSVT